MPTDFKKKILDIFRRDIPDINVDKDMLEKPKDDSLGDFALPCFIFAKELRKSPQVIANEISEKIKPGKYISSVKATGPYLNFFINKEILAKEVLESIISEKDSFGMIKKKTPHKMMIEFSSPNTNKPLHLGHLRNCFLGDSVSKIKQAMGNKVIKSCLVNDRGIHICKSMLAYRKWAEKKGENPEKKGQKGDHFVGEMYVLFAKNETDDLNKEAQDMLKKWEDGDNETVKLWKKMNSWVLSGFEKTYENIGISFDKYYYESDIYKNGKDIVRTALKKGKLYEKDGAIYAPLEEKYKIPDKVLLRSDGTSVYMTQDIFLALKKFSDYDLDESVYVVGSEQILHFKQLFAILDLIGENKAGKCRHLSYGMVYLPEGKMKSREGKVVDADDLILEMENLASEEITKRDPNIGSKELKNRSHKIAVAALKFFMLRIDPQKDMTYDPKESISFEGETGPYVQYAAVRIKSILDKKDKGIKITSPDFSLYNENEQQIAQKLSAFTEVIRESSDSFRPSLICNYLVELSQSFNTYYHKYPILKEKDKQIINARLYLINSVRQVILNGLALLGIEVPEKM
ncbi:MAG: arginine--tRNA ligase [Candidatus Woesearchaeota archaeon]